MGILAGLGAAQISGLEIEYELLKPYDRIVVGCVEAVKSLSGCTYISRKFFRISRWGDRN
jgi:hypothetical protein